MIKDKSNRIEELEEALRESVRITAQRELVMAEQQAQLANTDKQVTHWPFLMLIQILSFI